MKMHHGFKRAVSKKMVVNRPITKHANGSKCETGSTSVQKGLQPPTRRLNIKLDILWRRYNSALVLRLGAPNYAILKFARQILCTFRLQWASRVHRMELISRCQIPLLPSFSLSLPLFLLFLSFIVFNWSQTFFRASQGTRYISGIIHKLPLLSQN